MTFLFITSVENFIYNYVNNLQVYKGPYGHLKKNFHQKKNTSIQFLLEKKDGTTIPKLVLQKGLGY